MHNARFMQVSVVLTRVYFHGMVASTKFDFVLILRFRISSCSHLYCMKILDTFAVIYSQFSPYICLVDLVCIAVRKNVVVHPAKYSTKR